MAGNGAFEEAGQLGIERVIVVETTGNEIVAVKRTNLTAEQKTQFAIADNTASDFSTWDYEILEELASEVDLSEFFPDDKLNELLESLGKGEGFGVSEQREENEEEIAELLDKVDEIESRVKLGDIWELGRHRICAGDSTIEKNVRALLGDRFDDVGMVWSDPPYGIKIQNKDGRVGGENKKGKVGLGGTRMGAKSYPIIAGDENPDVAALSFTISIEWFPKAIHVWWGANNYPWVLPQSTAWIIWDKKTEKGDIEGIDFADAEIAYTNMKTAVRVFRHLWLGMWKASEVSDARVHPTQKPVALCEWCFEKYGNDNDLIFDPFLGSAPSIIAAEKMEGDRTVYGFELSPQYCTIILERFQRFTGIEPKLVGRLPD
ncbi:ParB-like partition protein [Planktothrix phage PaV-LD]|uniref:ParB-like partition protein n=1 Tax=Planktothrix phage PaV-LD TaxID=994601 RepID=UPI000243C931|nr:ParB-like partition protein [Planktothrix phage PaV-LD]ADZ31605.1 nuclease [Planktothrix phage PaV-LD]